MPSPVGMSVEILQPFGCSISMYTVGDQKMPEFISVPPVFLMNLFFGRKLEYPNENIGLTAV